MKTSRVQIDRGFYQHAKDALDRIGTSATEFLQRYPKLSKRELAESIGNGVTSRGITMVLFEEARERNDVGRLAKDLLFRKIVAEFPAGWRNDTKVCASVKLGSWHYDILEFAPEFKESAVRILRTLTSINSPEIGWKPESAEDERLSPLFEGSWRQSE